jgi:DNA mismatch repair protein MutS2
MAFGVSDKVLARLEWPDLVARLAAHAQTPRGRARCATPHDGAAPLPLFADSLDAVLALLHETSEARVLLDQGQTVPIGGLSDLEPTLQRLGKGGVLGARELLDLRTTLSALHATERFLSRRANEAPQLAVHAARIADLHELEDEIDLCIDAEGEVKDSASPALSDARREVRGLAADLQRRLAAYLHDPEIVASLSDSFVTMRNGRFVLPVRSDARTRVRGIVHDASGSGTTLFVEPEAVVELNNRMRQAELAVERETLRILRALSEQAAREQPALEAGLGALEAIDLAFARGCLSSEMNAVEPIVRREGVFVLPLLRHPLLASDRVVPNDVRLGESYTALVLSGPNAGGKTVVLKGLALAALCVRAGLHVPAAPGCRVDLVDALLADIGDEQNLRENLSTFSAHLANLARIVEEATPHSLVVLDEIGVGTDPSEGASLAQAILEALAEAGARVVVTTHFTLLKEMAVLDPRFANASVEFDPETLAPTYRLRWGVAGVSSAATVAARMGLRADVLERANALLERDDQRLDRMLSDLASSRAALERERSEAGRLKAESEAARAEYQAKLAKLEARREELFLRMRADLDRAFQGAHAEVAAVIRDLQRAGDARGAAYARERLQKLEAKADEATQAAQTAMPRPEEPASPVNWREARPGDVVRVWGGGDAVLVALPDRRGRVVVRVGGARLLVPMGRLAAVTPQDKPVAAQGAAGEPRTTPRVVFQREESDRASGEGSASGAGSLRCDVRGLHIEEALGRLVVSLDRAAVDGERWLLVVHGLGSGALRDAVRTHLASSPYVVSFARGDPQQGGDGVTVVQLEKDNLELQGR